MSSILDHSASRPPVLHTAAAFAIALPLLLLGCKSTSAPAPLSHASLPAQHAQYPPRPTAPPPPFHVFHTTSNSITLVTSDNATDQQISAILWQLRDAAHNHTFDALHIPQKLVDARDPIVWFHIYRGSRCAVEKYTTGKLPCGPSYHAAGDFTLGGFTKRDRTEGALLHGDGQTTPIWNPDTPEVPPPPLS